MVPQLAVLLRFAGSTGCCRMISCRSLAGCLRKIRDKGLMKHPHSREDPTFTRKTFLAENRKSDFSFHYFSPTAISCFYLCLMHNPSSSYPQIVMLVLSLFTLHPLLHDNKPVYRLPQQSIRRLAFVPPYSVFCSISFRCGGLSIERNQKPLTPEITPERNAPW